MKDLRIIEAKESQKEILQRLLELYQYDLSIITDDDVDPFGLYGYSYLDCYWLKKTDIPTCSCFENLLLGLHLSTK